jgi:hypothetical protein
MLEEAEFNESMPCRQPERLTPGRGIGRGQILVGNLTSPDARV